MEEWVDRSVLFLSGFLSHLLAFDSSQVTQRGMEWVCHCSSVLIVSVAQGRLSLNIFKLS